MNAVRGVALVASIVLLAGLPATPKLVGSADWYPGTVVTDGSGRPASPAGRPAGER